MEATQEFDKTGEVNEQILDDFESKEAEAVFESFFGDFSEEEQKILREFGAKFNIRSNDAIWSIVGIFIIFGRINNKLPQRIKAAFAESKEDFIEIMKKAAVDSVELENQKAQTILAENLSQISQEFFNQQRKKTRLYEFFVPLTCCCLGIFFLCLISFIGGSAVAGKGWGHSPVEALLNAPAGWIIPLALVPVGGFALFRGLTEQGRAKYLNLTTAFIVAVLLLCVITQIL